MKNPEWFVPVAKGLNIWVESRGNQHNEACLFINGAGANSSFWSENLCNALVEEDFHVIKYDHRDFGYSDKLDFEKYPYDVMDLARDVIAIMDKLNIEKSHIVGHSMGGFIAQLLAIHYPDRVITLSSISSSTGSPDIPPPPEETWKLFIENQVTGILDEDLEGFLMVWEYLNGTAVFHRELALEYTRNIYARQEIKGALGESHVRAQSNLTDRSAQLKELTLPAMIMHGTEDYLVDSYGGIQTAECIDGAKLILIPEMGHIPFNRNILERFENEIIQFLLSNREE